MRNLEILLAAFAFSTCIFATSNIYQKGLRSSLDVQAFNFEKQSVILSQTQHGGAEYLDKIIFLGDSRTYGLKSFAMLDGGKNTTQVWTPKNGTMSIWDMQYQKILFPETQTEISVSEAARMKKPEFLLISLGFNGFELVSKEYFVGEYTKLINAIKSASPSTTIILQEMFPVCRSYALTTNKKIEESNKWILEIAEETDSFYLATNEVLKDKDGYLIEEYSTDGCHLTPLGLDVQIEYICTHMAGGI